MLAGFTIGAMMIASVVFADEMTLSLPQNADAAVVLALPDTLTGNPDDVLQVFVGTADECCDNKMPIAGRYTRDSNRLSFTPAFGFNERQDYVARVRRAHSEEMIPFRIASTVAIVPAAVTEFYPSGDTLPENTLRFYIHFSVPMTPHVAFDYIRLRNTSGIEDESAFMRFKQELWNEDRTRLTVLFDPGRIKREVATNVELGPALLPGWQYSLSVEGGWPSADGASVLPPFTRNFTVSPALRDRPDVRLWKVAAPCVGTQDLLRIALDRPFDRHLLHKDIQIIAKDGERIEGTVQVNEGEMSWSLAPDAAWTHRELFVVAHTKLEDVAGNNFRDLLDHVASETAADVSATSVRIDLNDCFERAEPQELNPASQSIGN